MSKDQIKNILSEFVEQLLENTGEHIQMVRWYGSTARNEADGDSDIDVLVLADSENVRIRNIAFDVSADISLAHDCLLSVLFMSGSRYAAMKKSHRLLARNIEKDGTTLWQRKN